MLPFVGDSLDEEELRDLCKQAYGSFSHQGVTPLVQLDHRHWLLELFHGPTLAFKDVALQLLGLLFEKFLSKSNRHLRSEEHTSELQSLMRISYAFFCLKKNNNTIY